MKLVQSLESAKKQTRLKKLFQKIMESGQYTEGEQIIQAEAKVTAQLGCPALLLNSCGSSLFAVYAYYQSEGHQRAVMQNNTFYATGQMAIEAGIAPVLCDIRHDHPSMSVESMMQALEVSKSKLVVLTHVGGWVAQDYQQIAEYCTRYHIVLVEDCAHMLGVSGAGLLGDAACWSFYPTKAVPIGEGGAVSSKHPRLIEYVSRFRNYGKIQKEGGVEYTRGYNFRMSEWEAAIVRVQLEYLPDILAARKRDAQKLQSIAPCILQGESNFYKFPVLPDPTITCAKVGKVYSRTDQLDQSLYRSLNQSFNQSSSKGTVVSLQNSYSWADHHVCLPLGEGIYDAYTTEEVRQFVCPQS